MPRDNRLHGPLDASLHLLDRQVVDCEGLLVCKVDDVELTDFASVPLKVTGLLAGSAALVPRMSVHHGRRFLRYWTKLGVEKGDRELPYRIGLEDIESLGSDVRLSVHRKGYLRRQEDEGPGVRRRLSDLQGAHVSGPDGAPLGRVLDVRVEPDRNPDGPLRVVALIVGRGRPGTLLGYDRTVDQGPWLINRLMRRLHRRTGQIPLADAEIDFDARRVRLSREPEALRRA
jgi:sporulation protein YlmC with PRC-barrel domain